MFLSSQKNSNEIERAQKITESKQVLEKTKTVAGIKKSADILKLDAEDIKIETKEEKPSQEIFKKDTLSYNIKTTTNILNKIILTKNKNIDGLDKITNDKSTQDVPEDAIEVKVSNSVAQTIQSKIIGARQKLGSFMSEIARNTYLNYKPPVTAFRMNLNPANLGSISVMMKSNKTDKSISVSMNMSNSTTLEAFVDNKNSLHSALQKSFSDNSSSVSLEFGMQNDSSNSSFEQFKQEQNKNNEEEQDLQTKQNTTTDEEDLSTQDYM